MVAEAPKQRTREESTDAVRAAAGWSKRPGFSFTRRAIWPTSPGTTWPTATPATRTSVSAVPTGRGPTLSWTRPAPIAGFCARATVAARTPPSRRAPCRAFHSRPTPGSSPGCASLRRNPPKPWPGWWRSTTCACTPPRPAPPSSFRRSRESVGGRLPTASTAAPGASSVSGMRGARWHEEAPSSYSPASIAARPARSNKPSRRSTGAIHCSVGRSRQVISWPTSTAR